jgi:hypothetical protein
MLTVSVTYMSCMGGDGLPEVKVWHLNEVNLYTL